MKVLLGGRSIRQTMVPGFLKDQGRLFPRDFFLVFLQEIQDGFFQKVVLAFAKTYGQYFEFLDQVPIHAGIVSNFAFHDKKIKKNSQDVKKKLDFKNACVIILYKLKEHT